MIPLCKKFQLFLVLWVFGLALLGDTIWGLPMEDQDYYLQEIINRDHYYSFPDPDEFSPFTDQPKEEETERPAETEEPSRFRPAKKELKSKKANRKDKATLETPPGNFSLSRAKVEISDGSHRDFPPLYIISIKAAAVTVLIGNSNFNLSLHRFWKNQNVSDWEYSFPIPLSYSSTQLVHRPPPQLHNYIEQLIERRLYYNEKEMKLLWDSESVPLVQERRLEFISQFAI